MMHGLSARARQLLIAFSLLVAGGLGAEAQPASYPAGKFFALQPCRVLDTRTAGNPVKSGVTRLVQVAGACQGGVPGTAKAVSVNVTVTQPTGGGHLQVFPGNGTSAISYMNFDAAETLAKHGIAELARNGAGTLAVRSAIAGGGSVHVIVDVSGYFADAESITPGAIGPLGFVPIQPCRILDTRSTGILSGGQVAGLTVQGGRCGVPAGAAAAALNATAVGPSADGFLALYPADAAFSGTSNLNFPASTPALANHAIVGLGPSVPDLKLLVGSAIPMSTHAIVDVTGYFIASSPLAYHSIDGCRALDTRGGSPLSTGRLNLNVRAACALPPVAAAVAASVVVIGPNGPGFMTLFPGDSPGAPNASTINFSAGEPPLANGALVKLASGTGADLSLNTFVSATNGSAHALLDVTGFFAGSLSSGSGEGGDHEENLESGFKPEKAYQMGEIDSINLFNGNLNIRHPLGQQYPVGANLSYQLALVYNSEPWSFRTSRIVPGPDGEQNEVTQAYPRTLPDLSARHDNAGLGWRLYLGELKDPNTTIQFDPAFSVYYSPDGAQHKFFRTLHEGDPATATVAYTRDGTYLRLWHRPGDDHRELEFPNGNIHYFDSTGWLYKITNRFTQASVDVTKVATDPVTGKPKWTITDSTGRQHFVHFTADGRVLEVDLAAFGTKRAKYQLAYTSQSVARPWPAQETQAAFGGTHATVHFLTKVTLPDQSSVEMPLAGYLTALAPGTGSETSGLITGLRLPTRGRLEWDWGIYQFPAGKRPQFALSAGVFARRMVDSNGRVGEWTYVPTLTPHPNALGSYVEAITTVTDPLGHVTKNYFALDKSTGRYGWPFSTFRPQVAGKSLSREVFRKLPGGGLTKVRSVYVRYEHDELGPYEQEDLTQSNHRLAASRTVFHDDAGRFVETESSQFDGLGHYRRQTTSGDFPSADVKTSFTNLNPGTGVYKLDATTGNRLPGFTMVGFNKKWVLTTYTDRSVTDGLRTFAEQACFEPSTGFLKRRRLLKSTAPNPQRNSQDVIFQYEATTPIAPIDQGFPKSEEYFGGDRAGASVGLEEDLCTATLDVSQYRINHAYQYGSRRSSKYAAADFYLLNRENDQNTGLPKWQFDVADVKTDFEYDSMGRLRRILPAEDAPTEHTYQPAVSSGQVPKIIVRRHARGNPSQELARLELQFDGFGRLNEERDRRLGGGSTVDDTTAYAYDLVGNQSYTSENGSPGLGTTRLDFDPFGRPGKIRAADGSEVLLSYFGTRVLERTVSIGTHEDPPGTVKPEPAKTTERYDHHGRLHQVVEPIGTSTTYSYDPMDHLIQVVMPSGAVTQVRSFGYDGRGFLRWESHPEKTTNSVTPSDSGLLPGYPASSSVDHYGYDPLGNVGIKVDGGNHLSYGYDEFGRLRRISEAKADPLDGVAPRLVKEFEYGSGTSPGDRSKGRIKRAWRYNYPTLGNVEIKSVIQYTYLYGGRQGRVSRRDLLNIVPNNSNTESFTQSWTYDELGAVETIDYPACTFSPCRFQDTSRSLRLAYQYGLLTGVGDYATLTYHPNRLVKQVRMGGDGWTWDQSVDPANGMPRPSNIAINNTGGLAYEYDGAGNVVRQGAELYLYDLASRIKSFRNGSGLTQAFSYDAYGNLQSLLSNQTGFSRNTPTVSATNRLQVGGYDAAGNLTGWNGAIYDYDALDQMERMRNGNEEWLYAYDADDERVLSFQATGSAFRRWTLRDLDGKVLRTYEDTGWSWSPPQIVDHVYRGDRLLAEEWPASDGGRKYVFPDHLGTPRVIRDAQGGIVAHHYTPFGEEYSSSTADKTRMKFTGHERDSNNPNSTADDLDYMHARFYNPLVGRFTSTDPLRSTAARHSPQQWNRYSYANNNPLLYTDPDGRQSVIDPNDYPWMEKYEAFVFWALGPQSFFKWCPQCGKAAFLLVAPIEVARLDKFAAEATGDSRAYEKSMSGPVDRLAISMFEMYLSSGSGEGVAETIGDGIATSQRSVAYWQSLEEAGSRGSALGSISGIGDPERAFAHYMRVQAEARLKRWLWMQQVMEAQRNLQTNAPTDNDEN